MLVGGFGVLMGVLGMFVSCDCVCFRLLMFAHVMMMRRLKVVMCGCVVMCGGCVMMLAGRVFLLRHV